MSVRFALRKRCRDAETNLSAAATKRAILSQVADLGGFADE